MEDRLAKIQLFEEMQVEKYKNKVKDIEREHEKDRRTEKKKDDLNKILMAKKMKDEARQRKKADKFKHISIGKKMMFRSDPKVKKIVKEEVKKVNVEEVEFNRYFGEIP